MRRALAVAALAGMLVLAGCAGSVMQQPEATEKTHSYDWNTSASVTVTADNSSYRAVYDVEDDRRLNLSLRSEFGGREPLEVRNVAFRYENGTVVNESEIAIETTNRRTEITFPASNGSVAYTADSASRSLRVPVVGNRSHEVILPPGMRIGFPIFGGAVPGGYDRTIENDRVHLTWSSIDSSVISVDYYLDRDLYLFGGFVGVVGIVTGLGLVYYRWRIRRLEAARSRVGLGADEDS